MTAHSSERIQSALTTVHTGAVVLPACALLSDPRPDWRGFFVGYPFYFYFGFGGYRQTPTRAGAPMMPE
ncbi:MAG TPA: hypothetical protein DCL15_16295 [Chloroflexi bacterium]|nr:hypothetical protein [Chloroflexota bacterium]HHW89244.1 hypothetical protein [Chloroflexota bacterium]